MTTKKSVEEERLVRPVEIAADGYRAEIEWTYGRTSLVALITLRPNGGVAHVTMEARDQGEVDTRAIRSLRLERARELIRADIYAQAEQASTRTVELRTSARGRPELELMLRRMGNWSAAVGHHVRDFKDRPRPGAAGRSDVHYAHLASLYVQALGHPKPKHIVAEQAELSVSTVGNLLSTARDRGVLSEATPGRAGGELTAYGRSLLESAPE